MNLETVDLIFIRVLCYLALFALLFFLALTAYIRHVRRQYAHIPSPAGAGFYTGHLLQIASRIKKGDFFFNIMYEWYEECGPLFVLWRSLAPTVFVLHPSDIKKVACTQMNKPSHWQFRYIWGIGQRFLGESLFTVQKYEDWKPRRQVYDPAFSMSFLRSLIPQLNKLTQDDLISDLKAKADGHTVVDLKPLLARITARTISQVAFGTDFLNEPYVQSLLGSTTLTHLMSNTLEAVDMSVKNPLVVFLYPIYGWKYNKTARKIRDIGKYYIKTRFKELQKNAEEPRDILTYIFKIIRRGNSAGVEELVDDFATFYFAGQETTSNLLSFTILELLRNPDILSKLVQEVDDVVGSKDCVTGADLKGLLYTTQVLEETLRHHPPSPAYPRESSKGLNLSGFDIPTKSRLMLCPYVTHHIPELYDDPWTFNPSRFDADKKRFSPCEFIPFGIGHRSCIGIEFAMIEAKIILVLLLKTFTLSLTEGYQFELSSAIAMFPSNGVPCTIALRKDEHGSNQQQIPL